MPFPEEQSEAAAISALVNLIPEKGMNIGQAEESEANSDRRAEPKQTQQRAPEPDEEEDADALPEIGTDEGEEDEGQAKDPEAEEELNNEAAAPEDNEEIEIEIKGEKYKAPKAIESLIMMEKDYRQKTMALAEERKALEAQKGQADPEAAKKIAYYESLALGKLEENETVLAQINQALLTTDVNTNPIRVLELSQAKAQIEMQINAANQIKEKQAKEFAEKRSQAATEQWNQLIAKKPELKEEAKFRAHDAKVRTFLANEGYQPEEVNNAVFDHRVRLLAEEVLEYRALKANKEKTLKKLDKLPPKVERPGVSDKSESQAGNNSQAALARVKKTGSIEDAASAISSLMG